MSESPEHRHQPGSRQVVSAGRLEDNTEVRTPAPRPRKVHSATEHDGGPAPARRKRRSKRSQGELKQQSTQLETVITAVLGDLQDDIVDGPLEDTGSRAVHLPGNPAAPACYLNGNKVYVQRAHGFSRTTRQKVLCPSTAAEGDREGSGVVATPLGTAIAIQKHLLPFYTLCHGLLGGLALATFILSCSSGSLGDEVSRFAMTLSPFVHVTGTLFYFLAATCTVSVFDRFDLSNMDCSHIKDVVKYQGVGLVIVGVYLFTLVSTLACTQWDDGIALYHHNSSHWNTDQELVGELSKWHNLNLCRCAGGMLGWVLVAVTPAKDMLHDHLVAMLPYQASPGP